MTTETFYAEPISRGAPYIVVHCMLGSYVADRIGFNVGRSSLMSPGAVFFRSQERAKACCDALNGESK